MTTLEVYKSIDVLNKVDVSIDDLINLIENTSGRPTTKTVSADTVYLLYSGQANPKEPGNRGSYAQIAENLSDKDPNFIRLADTYVGELILKDEKFNLALDRAINNKLIVDGLELTDENRRILKDKVVNGSYTDADGNFKRYNIDEVNGGKGGLFDIASRNYVKDNTGKFQLLASFPKTEEAASILKNSVYGQVEFPELLKKTDGSSLDGIHLSDYTDRIDSSDGKFNSIDALYTSSEIADDKIKATGITRKKLDKYLTITDVELIAIYESSEFVAQKKQSFDSLDENSKARLSKSGRFLNRLGVAGGLISLLIAGFTAGAMELNGNHEGAKQYMKEWAVDAAGSEVASILAGITAGIATSALVAAGIISAPVAGALVLGATLIGGFFGGDLATTYYPLVWDNDGNGTSDLLDRMIFLMFGADHNALPDYVPIPLNGTMFKVDSQLSIEQMIEKAKTSIEWRFALVHLNTVVVEGIDYEKIHNKHGELDYDGMSESYWKHRAEMLYYRTQWDLAKRNYYKDWNTTSVKDDWDYVDLNYPMDGSQYLTLSIDGLGGKDHQIIFGDKSGGKLLEGKGDSDWIYGNVGNDKLKGNEGNDYLEGGKGIDTYYVGLGHDIVLDSDGLGFVIFNNEFLKFDNEDLWKGDNRLGVFNTHWVYDDKWRLEFTATDKLDANNKPTYTLVIKEKDNSKNSVTILDFNDGDLGIKGLESLSNLMAVTEGIFNPINNDTQSTVLSGEWAEGEKIFRLFFRKGIQKDEKITFKFSGNIPDGLSIVIAGQLYTIKNGQIEYIVRAEQKEYIDMHLRVQDKFAESGVLQIQATYGDQTANINYQIIDGHGTSSTTNRIELKYEDDELKDGTNHANVRKYGSGGNDLVIADGNVDNWVQLSEGGNDRFIGGRGNDAVLGGSGNDVLIGGEGRDALYGGKGDDVLYANEFIELTEENIKKLKEGEEDGILGRGDFLNGMDGNDTLIGSRADDYLMGGQGNDTIFGGAGNDHIYGDRDFGLDSPLWEINEQYIEKEATDYNRFGNWIRSNPINDDLIGGADHLYGGAGNDRIWAGAGDDYIEGGSGNDYISGGSHNDVIYGDEGNDTIHGDLSFTVGRKVPNSVIFGNDTIHGGDGNDRISGDGGDDVIYGDDGDDELYGDFMNYTSPSELVEFIKQMEIYQGSDHIYGGNGNDHIVGGGGNDFLYGGADNDRIYGDHWEKEYSYKGGTFDDVIDGGDGDDYLVGGQGSDTIQGGSGNDIIYGDHDSKFKGKIQNESLDSYKDYLYGGDGNDTIYGGYGNDEIYGGRDNDILYGQQGDDLLSGGEGDDILIDKEGQNTFDGGAGFDIFFGGDEQDIYKFNLGDSQRKVNENGRYELEMINDSVGNNEIHFGEGIKKEDILLSKIPDSNQYVLSYSKTDSIIVTKDTIEFLKFIDGTELSFRDLVLNISEETGASDGGATETEKFYKKFYKKLNDFDQDGKGPVGGWGITGEFIPVYSYSPYYYHNSKGEPQLEYIAYFEKYEFVERGYVFNYAPIRTQLVDTVYLFRGQKFEIPNYFYDPDGDRLSYNLSDRVLLEKHNKLELKHNEILSGDYTLSVSDGRGGSNRQDLIIVGNGLTVNEFNSGIWKTYPISKNPKGYDLSFNVIGGSEDDVIIVDRSELYEYLSVESHYMDRLIDGFYGGAGNDTFKIKDYSQNPNMPEQGDFLIDPYNISRDINLYGGLGDDKYYVEKDQQLTIIESDRNNILYFGEGLKKEDMRVYYGMDGPIAICFLNSKTTINLEYRNEYSGDYGYRGPSKSLVFSEIHFANGDIIDGKSVSIASFGQKSEIVSGEIGSGIIEVVSAFDFDPTEDSVLEGMDVLSVTSNGESLPSWIKWSYKQLEEYDYESPFGKILLDFAPPKFAQDELFTITFKVKDKLGNIGYVDYFLTVTASGNAAPEVQELQEDIHINEKDQFTYQLSNNLFNDPDNDNLAYQVILEDGSPLPSWLAFDPDTLTLFGNAGNDNVGTFNLKIVATDPLGLNTEQSFNIIVNNVNDAPIAMGSLDDIVLNVGQLLTWNLPKDAFVDVDSKYGDELSYQLKMADGSKLPNWIVFDTKTGEIKGSTQIASQLNLIIVATDQGGLSAEHRFNLNVQSNVNIIMGTDLSNILHGTDKADQIYGFEGDDILYGENGNDTLYGGEGNDKLYGGYGNDILIGGKGDDYLEGGSGAHWDSAQSNGNKIYQFRKGDGNDIINNYDYYNHYAHDLDIVKFTDVNSNEAIYRGENYDLIIEYGQGDSIRIQNFFKGSQYWINEIHFADKVMNLNDLRALNIPINVTVNNYQPNNWSGSLTITNNEQSYAIYGGTGSDTVFAGAGNDTVSGGDGDDVIHGELGDDILYGENGNDTLYGGEGNDKLYGGGGNDILIGGKGDDYLEGGSGAHWDSAQSNGNKIYQFRKGDGNDIINNYDYYNHYAHDLDIVKFTDVNSNEAIYRGENYDLIIEYGQGDSIRIQNFFKGSQYWINEIHFADKVMNLNDLRALNIPINVTVNNYQPNNWSGSLTITNNEQSYAIYGGTGSDTVFAGAGNDTVSGGDGDDVIHGELGDDILYGENGNDTLYGGEGNDKLYGGGGNDILIGGKGDDYLEGGSGAHWDSAQSNGNKTYQFRKGDGNDIINNYDYYNHYAHDLDIVKFTDVNSNEAIYRGENYDLIIEYGQGDSIRIQNFFKGSQYWINEIHFADKVMNLNDLRALNIPINVTVNNYQPNNWSGSLTITNNEQSYAIYGGTGSDTVFAGAGNDTVSGGDGDDVIHGELGDDILYGENGNDTLYGGEGNDKLYGGGGNDILIGGKGDDYLEGGSGAHWDSAQSNGNKIYQFRKGDGNDIINNYDYYNHYAHDLDIVKFTDVNSNEAIYRGENYDLIIEYGQGDSIRIQNFFKGSQYWINEIHFADKVMNLNDLRALNIPINVTVNNYQPNNWSGSLTITNNEQSYAIYGGTGSDTVFAGAGNDTVSGGDGDDVIHGELGDDILYGENGNDTLYGGEGNDKLYGGYGNDILIGGKGDDYLEGGSGAHWDSAQSNGNKTYQFRKGDGNDIINNYDYYNHYAHDLDIVKFTDVNSNEAIYRGENYDLIIEYGQGDSIRIQNFFKGSQYWINEIHFADGSIVKQNEIQGLIDAQVNQSLTRTMSMANESSNITVNQELHSLISAMASFDSVNNSNDDFMVTSESSLFRPIITASTY